MSTWWISGVENDAELCRALRQEADEALTNSQYDLLMLAARRIDELANDKQEKAKLPWHQAS